MKYCVDCKHYKPSDANNLLDYCVSPRRGSRVNPITGTREYNDSINRIDGYVWSVILGTCGSFARFFEKRSNK